jgi:hypothetical protein
VGSSRKKTKGRTNDSANEAKQGAGACCAADDDVAVVIGVRKRADQKSAAPANEQPEHSTSNRALTGVLSHYFHRLDALAPEFDSRPGICALEYVK